MTDFPCTKCGECCRHVIAPLDRGDGVCKNLKNNLCAIYEKRPTICNIKAMWKLRGKPNKKEYIKVNAKICNEMQRLANIDESFRIPEV